MPLCIASNQATHDASRGWGGLPPSPCLWVPFPPSTTRCSETVGGTSNLLLDQALYLRPVKQNALAQLLRWLAVADGAKVKNLCAINSQ